MDIISAMLKKFVFLFLLAIAVCGCATVAPTTPPVARPPYGVTLPIPPLGTIENPVVDSSITLSQALRKYAPETIKVRQTIVNVLYYSFDGKVHKGQVVIDRRLANDISEVFRVAFETRFPIKSVIPISHDKFLRDGKFNSDGQSMLANNTSAFNYRKATGSKKLSMHAYGFAIDINPVQNPYIKRRTVFPRGAVYNPYKPGTLTRYSSVTKAFKRLGWTWGGDWKTLKDYQHFEKVLR